MGNIATENAAGRRITTLLDAGSFVEIGGLLQPEQLILTCRKKSPRQMASLPVMV